MVPDITSGLISSTFLSANQAVAQVQSGAIRVIGAISDGRSKYFPDAPTMAEQGFAEAQVTPWFGVVVPRERRSRSWTRSARRWRRRWPPADVKQKLDVAGCEAKSAPLQAFADIIKADVAAVGQGGQGGRHHRRLRARRARISAALTCSMSRRFIAPAWPSSAEPGLRRPAEFARSAGGIRHVPHGPKYIVYCARLEPGLTHMTAETPPNSLPPRSFSLSIGQLTFGSFMLVLAVIIITSTASVIAIRHIDSTFAELQRLQSVGDLAEDIDRRMNELRLAARDFVTDPGTQSLQVGEAATALGEVLKKTRLELAPEQQDMIDGVTERLSTYRSGIERISSLINRRAELIVALPPLAREVRCRDCRDARSRDRVGIASGPEPDRLGAAGA